MIITGELLTSELNEQSPQIPHHEQWDAQLHHKWISTNIDGRVFLCYQEIAPLHHKSIRALNLSNKRLVDHKVAFACANLWQNGSTRKWCLELERTELDSYRPSSMYANLRGLAFRPVLKIQRRSKMHSRLKCGGIFNFLFFSNHL